MIKFTAQKNTFLTKRPYPLDALFPNEKRFVKKGLCILVRELVGHENDYEQVKMLAPSEGCWYLYCRDWLVHSMEVSK